MADRTHIAERVKFWEEQDKINHALIPRVVSLHETQERLARRMTDLSAKVVAETRSAVSSEAKRAAHEAADDAKRVLRNEVEKEIEELRSSVDAECSSLEIRLEDGLVAVRETLFERLLALETRMSSELAATRGQLEAQIAVLDRARRSLTILAAVATGLAIAGLIATLVT